MPDLVVGGMVFNGMERTLTPSHNLGSHTIKHLGKSETTGNFSTLIIRPLGDLTNISMSGYVVLLIELKSAEHNRIVLHKWIARGDVNSMQSLAHVVISQNKLSR